MHRAIAAGVFVLGMICIVFAAGDAVAADMVQPSQEEMDYYLGTFMPAMQRVKNALPSPPDGWIIVEDTKINPVPRVPSDVRQSLRFSIGRSYKRVQGVKDEKKRLDDAYSESFRIHRAATKPLIDELIKSQTDISLEYRKATRRKDQAAEKRLNEELEENGRKMRAIHQDADRKIREDLVPFLVKDTEASIQIIIDEDIAALQGGESISLTLADIALRREGEQSGFTGWKEGQTLILCGAWRHEGNGVYRTTSDRTVRGSRARTVTISITGDRKRAEMLLELTDLKSILTILNPPTCHLLKEQEVRP